MRKILVIDGGGIKGVFPASFLSTIEESTGCSIVDYFDLIVGTSAGGIIALSLGLGHSAKDTLGFYEELGDKVFAGNSIARWFRHWRRSKYDAAPLREALISKFQKRLLGESKIRLVVPSANLETGEVYLYKTAHHEKFERDYRVSAVHVSMATAAAPTYFPTHRNEKGTPLVDGGTWANNPVGLAAVEAVGILGWPIGNVRILSLGCTQTPLDIGAARNSAKGKGYWGLKAVDLMMALQSSCSIGTAQHLAGHENVHRINPTIPMGRFTLDGVSEIESLMGLGDAEARKALPSIRKLFFENRAAEFVPFRKIEPPS